MFPLKNLKFQTFKLADVTACYKKKSKTLKYFLNMLQFAVMSSNNNDRKMAW